MKFGKLMLGLANQGSVNSGDYAMVKGMEYCFKKMNIPNNDIIPLTNNDLFSYKGEYVIVPIFGVMDTRLTDYKYLKFSASIIPVFVSVFCTDPKMALIIKDASRGMPVGCRDEESTRVLRDAGCNAYTVGCISILGFEKRTVIELGKIFVCDIHESLYEYMPQNVKNNFTLLEPPFVEVPKESSNTNVEKFQFRSEFFNKRIQMISKETSLLITSRVHLALPSISMGIPVIVAAKGRKDERFTCVERFVPVYSRRQYKHIDWSLKTIDIEKEKSELYEIVKQLIENTIEFSGQEISLNKAMTELDGKNRPITPSYHEKFHDHLGYLTPECITALSDIPKIDWLRSIFKKDISKCNVIFYGAGQQGYHFYSIAFKYFKKCKSFCFMDNDSSIHDKYLFGHPIKAPAYLKQLDPDNLIIIITPNGYSGGAASEIASQLSECYNLHHNVHYFLLEYLMYTALQIILNDSMGFFVAESNIDESFALSSRKKSNSLP